MRVTRGGWPDTPQELGFLPCLLLQSRRQAIQVARTGAQRDQPLELVACSEAQQGGVCCARCHRGPVHKPRHAAEGMPAAISLGQGTKGTKLPASRAQDECRAAKGAQAGPRTAEARHRRVHALQHGRRHVRADMAHHLAGGRHQQLAALSSQLTAALQQGREAAR